MNVLIPVRSDYFNQVKKEYCNDSYLTWLYKHHCHPILICDFNTIDILAPICDLLLLTGGYDVDPLFSGLAYEDNIPYQKDIDLLDFVLLNLFHHEHKPVLGICRGMQIINMYFHGTLFQDIPNHQQCMHPIVFANDSILKPLYPKKMIVNSFHHQAIEQVSPLLKVEAMADDGIIEAISYEDYIYGVQWHPELLKNDAILSLFSIKNTHT